MDDLGDRMIADIPKGKGDVETVADIAMDYAQFQCFTPAQPDRVKLLVAEIVSRFAEAHKREIDHVRKFWEDSRKREIAELVACLKGAVNHICTHQPLEYEEGTGNCKSLKDGKCKCERCWMYEDIARWKDIIAEYEEVSK